MALKMYIKMHKTVLAICSLFMGFVLVTKKKGKLFVDVYEAGPRMIPVHKICSAQLLESACNVSKASCLQYVIKISTHLVHN
jgi:hypothetical protein